MNNAGATAVLKSVGEARPPEFMMFSGMPRLALLDLLGSEQWTRPVPPFSAKYADEARPPGIVKCSAPTEFVLAVSSGEAGSSCPRATGTRIRSRRVSWWSLAFLVQSKKARPVPTQQQSRSLLVKLGLLGLQSAREWLAGKGGVCFLCRNVRRVRHFFKPQTV